MTTASTTEARYTRDLSLAAWMQLHGLEMTDARLDGRNDYHFGFRDPTGKWKQLTVEWANSECRRFDDALRTLKKVAQQAR